MIAIGPRELKASLALLVLVTVLHMMDRIVAGLVQCPVLGCSPW